MSGTSCEQLGHAFHDMGTDHDNRVVIPSR